MTDTETQETITAPEAEPQPEPIVPDHGFEVGDVVTTMASEVLMTVEHIDDQSGLCSCVWFSVNDELCRVNFVLKSLRKADE